MPVRAKSSDSRSVSRPARGFRPQDRDAEIIRYANRFGPLTVEHIAARFFNDKYKTAAPRIAKLVEQQYLERVQQDVEDITRKRLYRPPRGARAAAKLRGEYPALENEDFSHWERRSKKYANDKIRHELAITDALVAFDLAAQSDPRLAGIDVERRDPEINDQAGSLPLRPDAIVAAKNAAGQQAVFFLEADCSTEGKKQIENKFIAYRCYFDNGYQTKYSNYLKDRFDLKELEDPVFRVLFVVSSKQSDGAGGGEDALDSRVRRLASWAERHRVDDLVWFTTSPAIERPFDPIWIAADAPDKKRSLLEE